MPANQEQIDFLKSYRDKFKLSEKSAFAKIEYVGFMQSLKEIYSDNLFVELLLQKESVLKSNFKTGKESILKIMEKAIHHYEEIP